MDGTAGQPDARPNAEPGPGAPAHGPSEGTLEVKAAGGTRSLTLSAGGHLWRFRVEPGGLPKLVSHLGRLADEPTVPLDWFMVSMVLERLTAGGGSRTASGAPTASSGELAGADRGESPWPRD